MGIRRTKIFSLSHAHLSCVFLLWSTANKWFIYNDKHMMQPFLLHPVDYGHGWRREKNLLNKGSYLLKDIANPKIIENYTVNKFGAYK